MTERQERIKATIKAFFDERRANVEWDWNGDGGHIVLVDSVFDIGELAARIDEAVRDA